jgi:hypothetical protein
MGPKALETDQRVLALIKLKFNLQSDEDWYNITADDIRTVEGGSAVLKRWNFSASLAIMESVPPPKSTHKWIPWLFKQLPRARFSWSSIEHQKEYADWLLHSVLLAKRPNQYASNEIMNVWYECKISDLLENRGATLAYRYDLNLHKMLIQLYPDHLWDGWRFNPLPKHYWKYLTGDTALFAPSERQRLEAIRFIDYCESVMQLKGYEEWHRVSFEQMKSFIPGFPARQWSRTLNYLLAIKYPTSKSSAVSD